MARALLRGGLAADAALAVLALEAVFLLARAWRRGDRAAGFDALAAVLPGACLLLALRAALTGGGVMVLIWLAASLPAHALDMWRRGIRAGLRMESVGAPPVAGR